MKKELIYWSTGSKTRFQANGINIDKYMKSIQQDDIYIKTVGYGINEQIHLLEMYTDDQDHLLALTSQNGIINRQIEGL